MPPVQRFMLFILLMDSLLFNFYKKIFGILLGFYFENNILIYIVILCNIIYDETIIIIIN